MSSIEAHATDKLRSTISYRAGENGAPMLKPLELGPSKTHYRGRAVGTSVGIEALLIWKSHREFFDIESDFRVALPAQANYTDTLERSYMPGSRS
jgi:hypothetical protein